ncbi:MAG: hypothetical protein PHT59_05730 [Candidatus Omnitrophica bacterium]|nr:hypothetical protein [Candidatus Omnitrophota bacterium]
MRAALRLAFFLCAVPVACCAQDWTEIKSDHFVLSYQAAGGESGEGIPIEEFCRDVLHKAEIYYERIALDLGYQRTSDFWTWDRRVKIRIYADRAAFLRSGPHPDWAGGLADYQSRTISSFAGSGEFANTILPHEVAHLIFRDFVGFRGSVPAWLDEGVAQWTEERKRIEVRGLVKKMYEDDSLLTIEDMMRIDPAKITSKENVYIRQTRTKTGEDGVLFLSGDTLITVYYIQSVSLVDFLIGRFGKNEFTNFCRQLRDGKRVEEALTSAYSVHLRSLEDFEKQWREYAREAS